MLEISRREAEDLLHLACKNGQVSLIKNLLKAKVNINAMNAKGLSPLHLAAIEGNIAVTNLLISEGANIEMKDSKWGSSPLLYACQNGRTKIVKILLEKGAAINTESDDETSAIHYAAQSGRSDLIDFLLQKGFDINCVNNTGQTPLHYILKHWNHPESKVTCLYEKSKIIIERGANINAADNDGYTVLHYAILRQSPYECQKARTRIVKLLVEKGADIEAESGTRERAIHIAVKTGNFEIVNFLLQKGSDINCANSDCGTTPLHYALSPYRSYSLAKVESICKMVKLLIENGAKVDGVVESHITPLTLAIIDGHDRQIIELLIFYGANVNYGTDILPIPPLHIAATMGKGYEESVRMLIKHGASINATYGLFGLTPLHYNAKRKGEIEIARILLESGADLELKTSQGITAFHFAIENENFKFIKLALEFHPALVLSLKRSMNFPIQYALELNNLNAFKVIATHCHKSMCKC